MAKQIIEVTQIGVVIGGAVNPKKRMIGTDHIVSISRGGNDTSVIQLVGGERINVTETYDELKELLGD